MLEIIKWLAIIVELLFVILFIFRLLYHTIFVVRKSNKKNIAEKEKKQETHQAGKQELNLVQKENKFLMLLPAHNEEKVIGNLIDSLKKLNYPKDKYEICLISDNSTDKTAQIGKEKQISVYERNDLTTKTKGAALKWFFKEIAPKKTYDAVAIIDADNIVEKDFLKYMNLKLNEGYNVVQGYRNIKNPTDNWISGGYAIFYWNQNKNENRLRASKGLSANLNGTGFIVSKKLVEKGWNTNTITEDIEFTIINRINGEKIGFEERAVVYDEQPTGFVQSIYQRERWTLGHFECFSKLWKVAIKKFIQTRKIDNLDIIVYMYTQIFSKYVYFLVLNTIILLLLGVLDLKILLMSFAIIAPIFSIYLIINSIDVVKSERGDLKGMEIAIITTPIFYLTWAIVGMKAVFCPNKNWVKIEHGKGKKNG